MERMVVIPIERVRMDEEAFLYVKRTDYPRIVFKAD